ncbi:MAG: T9SS type A sorting domain-containing protein [Bacteroidota bacterium]
MKKLLASFFILVSIGLSSQSINFTVTNVTPSYSITCASQSVVLSASTNYTAGPVTFYWGSASATVTGNTATFTAGGVYTVAAVSLPNYGAQTLTIYTNTVSPVISLSPTIANITCTGSPTTFTLSTSNPTNNITSSFLSPSGGSVSSNAQIAYYAPSSPGTYTATSTNQINGCKSNQTFSVTSNNSYPSYSLSSITNFSLGCSTKSVTSISLINLNPGTPGAPLTFTLIPPGASTAVTGPFSANSAFTTNLPGAYMMIVYESGSGCMTKTPFTILQNTIAPIIDSLVNHNSIINCNNPIANLIMYSQTPNTSFLWTYNTGSVAAANCSVLANTANPTSTVIGSYTCTLTDQNNLCKSFSTTLVYQNIFQPNAKIAANGSNIRTCLTPSLQLVNVSTTGIPLNSSFTNTLPVTAQVWTGPSPQVPASQVSTYAALVAGVYTMSAKDQNNGCVATATFAVDDCLGVNQTSQEDVFNFYPNPVKQQLNLVSGSHVDLRITDILGNVIYTGDVNNNVKTLDFSQYQKGIYFISLMQNKQAVKTYRLIKD